MRFPCFRIRTLMIGIALAGLLAAGWAYVLNDPDAWKGDFWCTQLSAMATATALSGWGMLCIIDYLDGDQSPSTPTDPDAGLHD